MRQNFDTIIVGVLASEGGYVDHPSDPGGATNLGITRATLARWRKVSPVTALPKQEVKNLTREEAIQIYKAFYWDAVLADQLPSGLDYAVFDFCVNSGPARAVINLQRLLGVADDGVIGPITLNALAKVKDLSTLIHRYQDDRLKFLKALSTFPVFGKGWTTRVQKVRDVSLGLLATTLPGESENASSNNGWFALVPIVMTILTAIFGALKK